MTHAIERAAAELRAQYFIPPVGAPENGSAVRDGWLVTGRGRRYMGLLRRYRDEVRLLAREAVEHLRQERTTTFLRRRLSIEERPIRDLALVLAIASREASPRGAITPSATYRCTYHASGLDSAWSLRHRLRLSRAVRRRLREPVRAYDHGIHLNEAAVPVHPAMVMGADQIPLFAAYVARSERQLRAQVRRVFGDSSEQADLDRWPSDVRRAWTQLSFGRGGGGGLVSALRAVRDRGAPLHAIFTDDSILTDSIRRSRVTAVDAILIERFGLRGPLLTLGAPAARPG